MTGAYMLLTQSPFSPEDLHRIQEFVLSKGLPDRPAGFGYPGVTITNFELKEELLSKIVDRVREVAREQQWPHSFDLGPGTGVNFLHAGPRDFLEPHTCTPLHELDNSLHVKKEHQLIECYYVCAIEVPSEYSGGSVGVKAGEDSVRFNLAPGEMLLFRADSCQPFMDKVIAGHHDMLWFFLCG